MSEFRNNGDMGQYLAHEALKYLYKNGPTVSLKEVYDYISELVDGLDDVGDMKDSYDGQSNPKYITAMNFKMIGFSKAGWIKKGSPKSGYWTITESGIDEMKKNKNTDDLYKQVNKIYQDWKKNQVTENTLHQQTIETEINVKSIRDKLISLDAYEFQDLTAGLLEGMGYFVDFNAPRGKDGGVDLVCYKDPLGAQIPRIKVQCKHRPDYKISRQDISQFAGVINNDEIGIFVTSGFFTSDAKRYSIERNIHIRLIDGQELEDMWAKYYNKIPTDKKILLPIQFIPELLTENI
jgi:restriction system protein